MEVTTLKGMLVANAVSQTLSAIEPNFSSGSSLKLLEYEESCGMASTHSGFFPWILNKSLPGN